MKVLIAFIAIVLGAGMYVQAPPPMMSYVVTANKGDTLWDICSKITTEKEDVREIISRTRKENNIKDPGALQPGQEIIVKVERINK
jgi:transcriptional accessory protein Tex/SPT6|nr:MAG TPA: Lysin motif [Caudoviricetes sp.]